MSTISKSDDQFAKRLKEAREARGLGQSELARKAGMVPSAIGHFEGNRRKPSFANVRTLAKALSVSSDYLLGTSESMEGATTVFRGEAELSGEDRDFIQQMIDVRVQSKKTDK